MSLPITWRSAVTGALVAVVLTPSIARSEPLGEPAIARMTRNAVRDWRSGMQAGGWVGMQTRISDCFNALANRPSEERAAYCIALDHLTLLDTMNFRESMRPPYFATDAVFARMDKAVARTAPAQDRAEFERRLLVTMQDTLYHLRVSAEARGRAKKP